MRCSAWCTCRSSPNANRISFPVVSDSVWPWPEALPNAPKLLLLDEPMGALDKKLRDRMQLEVVDILERVGVTCVMVTHDQEEAMTMAGRIAIMNRGKFVQIGEPEEIYEHPTTRYSAEFIGSVNVFEGVLKERQEDGLVLDRRGWCIH
ncbi:ABC-type spermidine/putrescine transport systems, ATPase components [Escherichia coli]|nr:ABC-type spermidine/putrescine transport systems, ATPase components [Escherichia coli]